VGCHDQDEVLNVNPKDQCYICHSYKNYDSTYKLHDKHMSKGWCDVCHGSNIPVDQDCVKCHSRTPSFYSSNSIHKEHAGSKYPCVTCHVEYTPGGEVPPEPTPTPTPTPTATPTPTPTPTPVPGKGYILSKNADYSTQDTVYARSDTIYVKIWSDRIDYRDMEKAEFEIKDVCKIRLTNNYDGTFTAHYDLSRARTGYHDVRILIEDDHDHRYEVRTRIYIESAPAPTPSNCNANSYTHSDPTRRGLHPVKECRLFDARHGLCKV